MPRLNSDATDEVATVGQVRRTVHDLHGAPKSIRHCAYRVWLNVFKMSNEEHVDEDWRIGLSSYCVDNFSVRFQEKHTKSLP